MKNASLKLYSRVGETPDDFLERCRAAAEDRADEDAAKLRDRFEGRMDTVRDRIERYRLDVEEKELDLETRRHEEVASGAGQLLSVLLGGRKRTSGLSSAARKRSQVRRAQQRVASAERKLSAEMEELIEMEDELAEDILEIDAKWQTAAEDIAVIDIGLEKSDVEVDEVALVWVPRAG